MKIVVFGACSAMAVAAERIWAQQGAEFYLCARSEERLSALEADLRVRGAVRIESRAADLADISGHDALLADLFERFPDFDTVLVAYGTLGDQQRCEESFAAAELELRTNFLSVVSLLTPLANRCVEKQTGTICVISSVAGDRGRQSNYVYGTAKGALSLYLQGLRNRLQPLGVKVITVKPGFTDTPMTAAVKKGPLFVGPEVVGRGIVRAVRRGADEVYVPWFWLPIMTAIKSIPEALFKRLRL